MADRPGLIPQSLPSAADVQSGPMLQGLPYGLVNDAGPNPQGADWSWLNGMNDHFNRNSKWAKPHPTYATKLSPEEEAQFRAWTAQNKVPFNPNDQAADYDMRGYFRGLMSGDPVAAQAADPNDIDPRTGKPRMHFPDKWKTPFHETFSQESQYALPTAPSWQGDRLVTPDGQVLFDDKAPKRK